MRLTAPIHSKTPSFALIVGLVSGLLAGQFFTARTMQVAEAATQERQLAAIQSARGAMNLIKYDMERAGYVETSPMSRASFQMHSGAGSEDVLQLTQAMPQSLSFRSPDGRATVEYRCEGTRLSRTAAGRDSEHVLLLAKALNFQIRQSRDGDTVNVAFAIEVGAGASPLKSVSRFASTSASQALVMAHFVRSTQ
jgi:hypothetical protein